MESSQRRVRKCPIQIVDEHVTHSRAGDQPGEGHGGPKVEVSISIFRKILTKKFLSKIAILCYYSIFKKNVAFLSGNLQFLKFLTKNHARWGRAKGRRGGVYFYFSLCKIQQYFVVVVTVYL